MKQYDFVFVYEVKNRELENICLIRQELERRGYRVGFEETWNRVFYRSRPPRTHVAVGYALYNDNTVDFITSHVSGCQKIVNMQWEQVFTNGNTAWARNEKGEMSASGVYGIARQAAHISWGEDNYKALTELYNVAPSHVRIAGHVALDFLRPELQGYYLSREELLHRYQIPAEKKVCLFISSLSLANFPEESLKTALFNNLGYDVAEYKAVSEQTQKTLVEWFEKVFSQRKDCVFIYRPHPAENNSKLLEEVATRCPNFRVIGDLSVKQWILAADKVYSWTSTSIAEIRAAGKGCGILRPVKIPYEADMEIYANAQFITDYDSFFRSLDEPLSFPIPTGDFDKFYDIDPERASYLRICDFLEEVYQSDEYLMPLSKEERPYSYLRAIAANLRSWLMQRYIHTDWLQMILKKCRPERDMGAFVKEYEYNILMRKKNYSTEKEIDAVLEKIRRTLSGRK